MDIINRRYQFQEKYNGVSSTWYLNPTQSAAQKNKRKSTINFKKAADITASGLWLTAIGFAVYKTGMFRNKSPENVLNKAKKIQKQYAKLENISKIQDDTNIDKLFEGKNKVHKFFAKTFYKLGQQFQNTKAKMGDELYNNLINSAGKLLIMPLVICASPVGKNESSKNEKASLIIREPLSVLATFTLQGAFDKIFDIYMPKILESNMFESEEIKRQFKQNGKVSIEQFENIKYNPKETKRLFVELTDLDVKNGGLKNILTKENAAKLITIDAFEPQTYESYIRNLEKHIEDGIVKKEYAETLRNKFKTVADSIGNFELAKIKPKIAMNVIVVVILSRIFLNVIHGKSINLLHLNDKKGENK